MGHLIKIATYATRYTTTTSMATPQQQEVLFKEGRILLSLNAYKQGQFTSFRKATSTYDVPRSTAQRRHQGIAPKLGHIAPNRRLTPAQEESLKQWILSRDQRGMPPRIATLREIASVLAAQRAEDPIKPIGEKWVYNFIKRNDDLQSKFNRKYNYKRAKCEDPILI